MVQDPSAVCPQASGVTEFLSHSTSSQPSPASRLFSPSAVQDALVKGEQAALHGGPQAPAAGSSEYSPEQIIPGQGATDRLPQSSLGPQNLSLLIAQSGEMLPGGL